jgi:hypothetical protein
MPVSSMLFTWVAESIVLGLIAYSVCERNYLIYSQLAVASLNGALHAAALAASWDAHYSISVSYLCVVTSMLVCDCAAPLDAVGPIITRSFFIICELAALAMTFSSCAGPTPLFFHARGHFALLLCVGLQFMRCWNGLIGGAIVLVVVATQCIPVPKVALAASAIAAAAFAVYSGIKASWWNVGAGGVPLLISAAWLAYLFRKVAPTAPAEISPVTSLMVWPRARTLSKQS